MRTQLLLLILLALAFLFVSCDDENPLDKDGNYDCKFVQIDENRDGLIDDTERAIMDECLANRITSKDEVIANFIGEWELIGHGEGWMPTVSQPCAYMWVSEDEIIFEYRDVNIDTTTTHSWEIEERNSPSGSYLQMNVIPEGARALGLGHVCKDYMFWDGTPFDGNMYLYQKVK